MNLITSIMRLTGSHPVHSFRNNCKNTPVNHHLLLILFSCSVIGIWSAHCQPVLKDAVQAVVFYALGRHARLSFSAADSFTHSASADGFVFYGWVFIRAAEVNDVSWGKAAQFIPPPRPPARAPYNYTSSFFFVYYGFENHNLQLYSVVFRLVGKPWLLLKRKERERVFVSMKLCQAETRRRRRSVRTLI